MKFNKLALAVASAVSFGVMTTGNAAADSLDYQGAWAGSWYSSYNISDSNPSSLSAHVYAGGFKMQNLTAGGPSFLAWCVDIYGSIQDTVYNYKTASQFYGAGSYKITDLERLASYAYSNYSMTNSLNSAAFQLAAWEIVSEANAPVPNYSLSGGDFKVTGGGANYMNAVNLANSWLSVVDAGNYAISYKLNVWQDPVGAPNTQDLAIFTPVPEPEIYAMMAAGLGLMGFVARRRKQAVV